MDTLASSQNYGNASVILYYAGRHFDLPYRYISFNNFGQTYYVPARTILIKLEKGSCT